MAEKHILDYLSRLEVSKERQEEIINLLSLSFKEEIKENEVENAFTRLKFFYIAQYIRAQRGIRQGVLEPQFSHRIDKFLKEHNLIVYVPWGSLRRYRLLGTSEIGSQIGHILVTNQIEKLDVSEILETIHPLALLIIGDRLATGGYYSIPQNLTTQKRADYFYSSYFSNQFQPNEWGIGFFVQDLLEKNLDVFKECIIFRLGNFSTNPSLNDL